MIMLSVIATVMITVPLAYQSTQADPGDMVGLGSGTVSITEVSEVTVNGTEANYASLVKHNSTKYSMFYTDSSGDGQVVYITIGTSAGLSTAAPAVADAYATTGAFWSASNEFNATDATYIHAQPLRYGNETAAAVVYTGNGADGYAQIVNIGDNTITNGPNLEFDVVDATHNAVIVMNDSNALIAYQGAAGDGFVKNWDFANEPSTQASLEVDTTDFAYPSWAGWNNSVALLAYQGAAGDGFVKALNFDPNVKDGNDITAAASLEYNTADSSYNDIIMVYNGSQADGVDSVYAIAYQGASGDGYVKTISASQDVGGFTIAAIDEIEFDTADAAHISIAEVADDVFAITYAGVDTDTSGEGDFDGDGFLQTVIIHDNGDIGANFQNELEFDITGANGTTAIRHDDDSIVLGYIGADKKGYLSTFTITKIYQQFQAWEDTCVLMSEVGTVSLECTKGKTGHSNDQLINLAPLLSDEIRVAVGLDADYILDAAQISEVSTIVADPGELVKVTLNISDDGGSEDIQNVALYTNFGERPSDMNYYYASNFNEAGDVSKTLYQWNKHSNDRIYDSTSSVTWEEPTITSNEDGTMTISFVTTFNDAMAESDLVAEVMDSDYGLTQVTLPFKLKVGDYHETYEEIFGINPNYRIATSVAEPLVIAEIQNWNMDTYGEVRTEYDTNGAELLNILGLRGESLPEWTKNLSQWVLDDQIDVAELIIALEYLSNTYL